MYYGKSTTYGSPTTRDYGYSSPGGFGGPPQPPPPRGYGDGYGGYGPSVPPPGYGDGYGGYGPSLPPGYGDGYGGHPPRGYSGPPPIIHQPGPGGHGVSIH